MANKDTLRILQWNSRWLSTNFKFLKQYIDEINPHVISIQSLNVNYFNLPKIQGYFYPPVTNIPDNKNSKLHTGLYMRDDTQYVPITSPVPKDSIDAYGSAIKIRFNEKEDLNIASIYLPKGPNNNNNGWIDFINNSKSNWLITGDFNSHSPYWDSKCIKSTHYEFENKILTSNLVILNDGRITRVPEVKGHRPSAIDLTFIAPKLADKCTWDIYDDSLGSDHYPIIIDINDYSETLDEEDLIPKFQYKKANWQLYKSILSNKDIDFEDDIENIFSNFKDNILDAARASIPLIKKPIFQNKNCNVWWTDECNTKRKEKNRAVRNWLKNTKDDNLTQIKQQANIVSNRTVAEAQITYWIKFCQEEIHEPSDSPKVWKEVSKMSNGYHLPKCPIKDKDKDFSSNKEKAEIFVDNFARICSSFSSNNNEEVYETQYTTQNDNETTMNTNITLRELKCAIDALKNKKSAVGPDGISYTMLSNLPEKWLTYLLHFFQKCWSNGYIPEMWKSSIIIPILKQGKSRTDPLSYRPISLTSHFCKLYEKIILGRINYHCIKHKIIPIEQAGFKRGRSTMDHVTKITGIIKNQFSRHKSLLATFFDVKKAYDRVKHDKLIIKLQKIGFSGNLLNFIKSFLRNRKIISKVGNSYSLPRNIDLGIPQGSIISPILFNLLIHDLPTVIGKNAEIVQYADDIALWMKVKLRKKTTLYEIKHIQKLYQCELDNVNDFMKNNGLELSSEKTNLILFNNGQNPKILPKFYIDKQELKYVSEVKFLGVYLTNKLCWKKHIEYLLHKAGKSFNLIKVISSKKWGKNSQCLIHLSMALIRSKLSYGQEVYFSAPKSYLDKLQSLDSRAIKLSLGLPVHTKTLETYKFAGLLSLDEWREMNCAKYIIRSQTVENNNREEINIRSDLTYPRKTRNVKALETIASYTTKVFENCYIDPSKITHNVSDIPIPNWSFEKANFNIDYSQYKKGKDPLLLTTDARMELVKYQNNSLLIYTDGSVINDNTGAGFIIPDFKMTKSFHLGKGYSVYTAELLAILMALNEISNIKMNILNITFCVDSLSVLQSLKSNSCNERYEIIYEIQHIVNSLIVNGTNIQFLWIPSHCNFRYNDLADMAAKNGALNINAICISIPLSKNEMYSIVNKYFKEKLVNKNKDIKKETPRLISNIARRFKLNALKTKYCKPAIQCVCKKDFSLDHIFKDCSYVDSLTQNEIKRDPKEYSLQDFVDLASTLYKSDIGDFL